MRSPSLDALAPDVGRRVASAAEIARKLGTPLYLAGGAVRDLLLGRAVGDVDLVVPSDAASFAQRLAKELGGRAKIHERFGTATVELPGGYRLDVATARAEEYDRPGALPRVRPGSLVEDLARRDFTVNAMAAEIGGGKVELVDPFGGVEDLEHGVIRALHPRSFADDPTRAFRAVRYANRLQFRIEPSTLARIRDAARCGALDTISADRLRREVTLLFSEPRRANAARALSRLGLAGAIHPTLRYDADAGRRLRAAERLAADSDQAADRVVYLLSWMGTTSERAAREIASRLNLPRGPRQRVAGWPKALRELVRAARGKPGALAALVSRLDDDTVLAAAATAPPGTSRAIRATRAAVSGFRLGIGGADLIAAGIAPGPAVGRALARTLDARRAGSIGAAEELAYALKAARR